MRPFQIGLLAVFGLVALISLVVLASFQGFGIGKANPYGNKVVIWGTLDQNAFTRTLQEITRDDRDFLVVQYVQKDARSFKTELVDALAEGKSPDAILLSGEDLVSLRTKLQPIPFSTFSQRALKDAYLDGFEIFAMSDGLYGIPFAVDPLVMYWNRDILASSGYSLPPTTWESLTSMAEKITLRDATRNISQSTVAFGEYENINNAKSILLTLLLQSGSKLVEEAPDRYKVSLNTDINNSDRKPLTSSLQFYSEFNNPSSPVYSWNRSFQDDLSTFLSGKLALYFGFGSEANRIGMQNPNLNFDVTAVPQGAGSSVKRVYGKFYGFSILRASPNQSGAYNALAKLASAQNANKITTEVGLAPAFRGSSDGDAIKQTIINQSIIARSWLDPEPAKSNNVFLQTIQDIQSGRSQISGASSDVNRRLELSF